MKTTIGKTIYFSAAFAALALAATTLAPTPAHAQAKLLKLGSLCTITGPTASIGKECLSGLEYGVKEINAAGGLKVGSDVYTVQLVNLDDESKQERAVAAAEKLVNSEKVSVVFTTPASTTTLAILPILEKNKTLAVSFVAAAPAIISPEFSYSFRTTLSSIDNINPSVDYLVKEKGVKSIAYLGRNDDWGRSAGKALVARAKSLGVQVVVEEYFDLGSTDFSGLLTKIRGSNADAVMCASLIEDGVPLLKQFREMRMKSVLLSPSTIWSSPTFLKAAGKNAEGIYIATGPQTSDTAGLRAYAQSFEKATGHAPLPYEVISYDTLMLVMDAMKKAGSIDATKVRDTMKNLQYTGLLQEYKFGGSNQSEVVININEVKDSKVAVVSSLRTR